MVWGSLHSINKSIHICWWSTDLVQYLSLTVSMKSAIGCHYVHLSKLSVTYTRKFGTLLLISWGYWCVALVLLLNWSCYCSLGWITRSTSALSLGLLFLLSVRVEIGFAGARKTPVWVILWLKEDIYWFWNLSIQLERENSPSKWLKQDRSIWNRACLISSCQLHTLHSTVKEQYWDLNPVYICVFSGPTNVEDSVQLLMKDAGKSKAHILFTPL